MQVASIDSGAAGSPDVIKSRGYWRGVDEREENTRSIDTRRTESSAGVGNVDAVAEGAAPWPLPRRDTGALAFAPANAAAPARVASLGGAPLGLPSLGGANVRPMPTQPSAATLPPHTTVAAKRVGDKPSVIAQAPSQVRPGETFNDPWLRAMIVSPSAHTMSASLIGHPDYRTLAGFLEKPAASVMMIFSEDPHHGVTPSRFDGNAVVFVSTVTFVPQRTAMLR